MRPHISLSLLGLLALGLGWGSPPAAAQYPNLPDPFAGRGSYAPSQPFGDPYHADRPAYRYGPQGYGQPYGPQGYGQPHGHEGYGQSHVPQGYGQPYAPQGYSRPSLPEEPPYGGYPPQAGYGPPAYRESYRPAFPGPAPGAIPGYGTAPAPRPPAYGGSPQLVGLADSLAGQVDGFLQAFTATARDVPEGEQFLADAQALSAAAGRFRQLAASGVPPGQLSLELRAVEDTWQRLQQRTQRIARGRTGPNIQQVGLMGNTLQQMRQVLP